MLRGTSKEATIIAFFTSAPLAVANVVYGIVRSTMKERNTIGTAQSTKAPAKSGAAKRRARRARKVAAVAAPAVTEQPQLAEAV